MALIRLPAPEHRTQWETYFVADQRVAQMNLSLFVLTLSTSMQGVMLGFRDWKGIRYVDSVTGEMRIGYGFGDPDNPIGMTEEEAFGEIIGHWRERQRLFNRQLPLDFMPQGAYDALLSLYIDTGTWRTVTSNDGTYDMRDAVLNANWKLAADILMRGSENKPLRQAEASVMQLGFYNIKTDRTRQRILGLQALRKRYDAGTLTNDFERTQAEFSYYRTLGAFLPGMTQLRQRRILARLNPR